MIARELLATEAVPGGGEMRLWRRGGDFAIMLGGNELMSSRLSGSEEALAELACAAIGARPGVRMLIGGLGMGFTLRAALERLGADAAVVVAELMPEVVAWGRGPMAALFAGSLDDPRTTIIEGDVIDAIRAPDEGYDAILLDVDNGPDGLTRAGNDQLYGASGLAAARSALRPGGVLAIWSAAPSPRFARALGEAGFAVAEHRVRAQAQRKGAHHVVWLATKR